MTAAYPSKNAIIIGSSGGIGTALSSALEAKGYTVSAYSRTSVPALDITSEDTISQCARHAQTQLSLVTLILVATGFLHNEVYTPEKGWGQLSAEHMARSFALNAIGPALIAKHFLPLLASQEKSIFAALSARIGSIKDNKLGGWYSYRASKAALNQLVRTLSVELRRKNPNAICIALHPGTVDTKLTAPFMKTGLDVQPPSEAASKLLLVLGTLTPQHSGGFFDHNGKVIEWQSV